MIYFVFFNEKFSIHFFIALITTFIGVFGLIFFSSSYQEGSLYGDLICILAAMFYAIYLVMISRLGHEQALTVIFLTTSFCCFFAFLSGLFENSFIPQAPLNVLEWVNMLSLAIICQVIGVFLITFSIACINASAGSITINATGNCGFVCCFYFCRVSFINSNYFCPYCFFRNLFS